MLNRMKGIIRTIYHNPRRNIYLIYSMGKVGSSTFYSSLKEKIPLSAILHTHFLSHNWLEKILPQLHHSFHLNIHQGKATKEFLKKNQNRKKKIVTLVREPMSRAISDCFQNWKHLYDSLDGKTSEDIFLRLKNEDHHYTLSWFDSEFKEYLDFDIYSVPFNKELGHQTYYFDNFDLLCVKLEMLNKLDDDVFIDFFGFKLDLKNSNLSKDKPSKDLFKEVVSNYREDAIKLDAIYTSKYVEHFYTKNEIEQFKSQWSN